MSEEGGKFKKLDVDSVSGGELGNGKIDVRVPIVVRWGRKSRRM
jgi:hypothetical protein